MKIQLGHTYRDVITGFTGVCTGYVQYLTGCNQALIAPKSKPDGSWCDSAWLDESRLEHCSDLMPITLHDPDQSSRGFDAAPPTK